MTYLNLKWPVGWRMHAQMEYRTGFISDHLQNTMWEVKHTIILHSYIYICNSAIERAICKI